MSMSSNAEHRFAVGDLVIHPDFNKGLTSVIEYFPCDENYAVIKYGEYYTSVLISELIKYEPKEE